MINQEDKAFLIAVADKRIQLHYSKHPSEILPDKKHFLALDVTACSILTLEPSSPMCRGSKVSIRRISLAAAVSAFIHPAQWAFPGQDIRIGDAPCFDPLR